MRQGLYVVYDRKVGNFGLPFFAQTSMAAKRTFCDALRQEGTMMQKHPEDFTLVHIAYVMDESGSVEPLVNHELVYDGQRFVTDETNKR